MASLKRTIDIIFNGVDKTGKGVNSALGNINKVTSNIQSAASPLANATTSVLKFETAVLAGGAAITAFSVKVASDFDTAFREISTLIDVPLSGLNTFRTEIQDYAKTSTQSLDQITQSIYSAISAGIDYKDSIGVVSQAEKLAVAGKGQLSDALVVLVSSLNAFGKGSDSAQGFADALFTTVKQGQTTLPELSASLAQVTGVAANAGLSFDEMLAAIAALTSTGLSTSQSVTSLKAALSNLIKPSSEAQKLAKKLGIEFNSEAVKAKGLKAVLDSVKTATGGNAQQMARLFGSVEALNGVLVLTGKGATNFSNTLDAMSKKSGAVQGAFKKMSDSGDLLAQKLTNNFKSVLLAIGQPLLDEFGGITQALSAIFGVIEKSLTSGKLQGFVKTIEGIGQELETTLQDVAKNLPAALDSADYSGFTAGLDTLKQGITDLLGGADLSSVDGLKSIIEGVGSAFNGLASFTVGVGTALKPVINLLIDAVKWFNGLSAETKAGLGYLGGMSIAFDKLAPGITAVATAIIAFNLATASMVGGLARIVGFLGKAGLAGSIGLATYELGKWVDLNDRLVPGVDTLGTKIYELVNAFSSESDEQKKIRAELDALDAARRRSLNTVKNTIDEINNLIKAKSSGIATEKEYKQRVDALADSFQKQGFLYDKQTGSLVKINKAQKDAVDQSGKYLQVIKDGQGNITGYTDGISGIATGLSKVSSKTKEAEKKTDEFVTKMEQIASNERIKTIEFGVDLKIAQIESDTKRVESAFKSVDNVVSSTGDVLSSIFSSLDKFRGVSEFDAAFKLVKSQAETENKARNEAFKLQKKLTEAEISLIKEKTNALINGDALIKIESDGLEQHIEAFMWEILKKIQVRGNAEFTEFLLGVIP